MLYRTLKRMIERGQTAGLDERSAFAGNIHDFHKAEPPQQRVRKQR